MGSHCGASASDERPEAQELLRRDEAIFLPGRQARRRRGGLGRAHGPRQIHGVVEVGRVARVAISYRIEHLLEARRIRPLVKKVDTSPSYAALEISSGRTISTTTRRSAAQSNA